MVYDRQGQLYKLSGLVRGYSSDRYSRLVVYEGETAKLSKHGIVEVDKEGFIVGFEEKPKEPKSNLVNASVYLYNPMMLKFIKERFVNWEECKDRNVLEFVAFDKMKIKMEKVAKRRDIGSLEDVLEANLKF